MVDLGPFAPLSLSASIIANLATDILKHRAQSIEGTLAGRMLKSAGLIERNLNDRLRETIKEALMLYFERYPAYCLTGIETFFRDPLVSMQITNHILDRKPLEPIDREYIHSVFIQHMGTTVGLIQQRGLEPETILPNFLTCYRQVLSKHLDEPQLFLLLRF